MRRIFIGVLIFFTIMSLIPNVEGAEDQIYLYVNQGEETDHLMVFVGEYDVNVMIIFGQNGSNWEIAVNNPLFAHSRKGIIPDTVKAGKTYHTSLDINPQATLGNYSFSIYLNYTNENNQKITNQFNFTISYMKALEIKEIKLPKKNEREFSLTIETFINFSKLNVEFDSDGDIETEKHEIILENISIGNYTFKTKIYKTDTFPEDAQELGYWIVGTVNNRTVEFGESNIPVHVEWDVGEGFIPSFETSILLICIFIISIIKWKRI